MPESVREYAQTVLEAAGVPELVAERDQLKDSHSKAHIWMTTAQGMLADAGNQNTDDPESLYRVLAERDRCREALERIQHFTTEFTIRVARQALSPVKEKT